MTFDDNEPAKKTVHEIGCDLTMISVAELEQRIALLHAEIERLSLDIAEKKKSRSAADAIFKS